MSDKDYWSRQTSSLHRFSTPQFYRAKAVEHVALMKPEDRDAGALDLGCGAGELLENLIPHIRIDAGMDYSPSMLEAARARLGSNAPRLEEGDVFDCLPAAKSKVWLTTGALNQYLSPVQIKSILDIFKLNDNVSSFYLYDCVDPVRYRLLNVGLSYRIEQLEAPSLKKKAYAWFLRVKAASGFLFGGFAQDAQSLGLVGMGYGFLPRFWLKAARERGLSIEIVSSKYYEYRYHVVLTKEPSGER